MIDADRKRCTEGYRLNVRGDELHIWPFGSGSVGLVVIEREGEPVSLAETRAATLPLRDDNVSFLADMWLRMLRAWRRQ